MKIFNRSTLISMAILIVSIAIFSTISLALFDSHYYMKEVTFTENSGFDINDYPVIFLFDHEGHANSECSDIRITFPDNTSIPFSLRNCGPADVELVTKINLTAYETETIHVYYGNRTPVNSTASAWNDVRYNFWDDFNDFDEGTEWQSKWDKMWYSKANNPQKCKAEVDNTTNMTLTDGRAGFYDGGENTWYDDCRSSFVTKQTYDMRLMNITAEGNNSANWGSSLYIATQQGNNNTMNISISTNNNTKFYIAKRHGSSNNHVETKLDNIIIPHYTGDYHAHVYTSLLINLIDQTHGNLIAYENTTKVVDNIIYPHVDCSGNHNFDMYIGIGFTWNDQTWGWDYWDDVYAYKCFECFDLVEPTIIIGPQQVNMINPLIFLAIDNQETDVIAEIGDDYSVIFWKDFDEGEISLYEDGSLQGNTTDTIPITLFNTNASLGTYNYTLIYPLTWKYFETSVTRFLTVVDPLSITVDSNSHSITADNFATYLLSIENTGSEQHEINISITNTDFICHQLSGVGYICIHTNNKTEDVIVAKFNTSNYFNVSVSETKVISLTMEAPEGNYNFDVTISDKIEEHKQDSVAISLEVLAVSEPEPEPTPPSSPSGGPGSGPSGGGSIVTCSVNNTIMPSGYDSCSWNTASCIWECIELQEEESVEEETFEEETGTGPTGFIIGNPQVTYLSFGIIVLMLGFIVYYYRDKIFKREFRYKYKPARRKYF